MQEKIKTLVSNGQIDIVHGGMVSTDEACPDYADIIRNFEQAQSFLDREFGVKPKIGWQLDAFGHSAANAYIFAELGLEAMVFARINEQDKSKRLEEKGLQFIWSPKFATFDQDFSEDSKDIFAHILYDHYDPPHFIKQELFTEGKSRYGPTDTSRFTEDWLEYFEKQQATQRTNNVLVMWGGDFSHQSRLTYSVLDQIIDGIQEELDTREELQGKYARCTFESLIRINY